MTPYGGISSAAVDTTFGLAFQLAAFTTDGQPADFDFSIPAVITVTYRSAFVTPDVEPTLLLRMRQDGEWFDAAATCSPKGAYVRALAAHTLSVPVCVQGVYELSTSVNDLFLPTIVLQR